MHRWMEAFFHRGYELSIVTDSKTWVAPEVKFARVYTIPTVHKTNFPRRYMPNILKILRTLKAIDPNLVHLHVQYWYGFSVILGRFPFLLTSWGAEVLSLPRSNMLIKSIAKMAASRARFVTVDAYCLKEIWMQMGVSKNKIKVIPFGVDLSLFNPFAKGSYIRRNLGIRKDAIVIISTRVFDNDHYNLECLIKAIPLVLKNYQNAFFILKGAGPLGAYLQNLVNKLEVSDHVRFVGLTPYHEMAQYLSAADIYVSTSFIDTTSVSLLEAMACGIAPISTDILGNREWIEDGINGLLYSPKNSTALSEKIIQLIGDENTRRRFGERCFHIVKRRASWEACVDKMESLYQSIV